MKKIISILLVLVLVSLTVTACGTDKKTAEVSSDQVTTSSKKESSSSKEKPSSKAETSSKEEEIKLTELQKIYYGLDPDLYKLGLKNKGDSSRIAALMKKAQKGGNYKIAVLGGSISEGAGASSVYSSYGNLVREWWAGAFPSLTLNL